MAVRDRPLSGKVAVVTGAGRGIGRAHAVVLAAQGAAVVVNDLGVALDGSSREASDADEVVAQIIANGGKAIHDGTDVASIAGGVAVVQRAIEAFGRIDIVINNAGFATGAATTAQPNDAEIDALLAVHLKAALGTMSAAFPHMIRQGWGRVINTVSEVALDPRFESGLGYSIAKAAVWSATLVAAREGATHGITVNAISPGARTRMNAELLDAGFRDGASASLDLDPVYIARVVAFLVSNEAADINGRIVHVAGPAVREYATTRTSQSPLVARADAWLATNRVGLE